MFFRHSEGKQRLIEKILKEGGMYGLHFLGAEGALLWGQRDQRCQEDAPVTGSHPGAVRPDPWGH